MAELNRQVLINLHSDANALSDATLLLHGEVAIKHDNVTGATIYTRTTDDKVAKFITDLAVDAKIKPVADELKYKQSRKIELKNQNNNGKEIENLDLEIKKLKQQMHGIIIQNERDFIQILTPEQKSEYNKIP